MSSDDGPARRAGREFRAGLRRELPGWRAEGLIDERAERLLVERYRLGEEGADLATAAVYFIGALLVGGGVISFVAWNWDHIPDTVKLAAGLAAMLAAHIAGHRLWRVTGAWPRLGHALTVVGTLLFGANIGLVAQVWNLHSAWYGGYGAWAIGATAAAWALRSAPQGALAAVLATVWSCGFIDEHARWVPYQPLGIAAAFLPLAWVLRSRSLFLLTWLGVGITAAVAAGEAVSHGAGIVTALLCTSAALLAWPFAFGEASAGSRFAGDARSLGFFVFGWLTYIAGFHESARDLSFDRVADGRRLWVIPSAVLLTSAIVLVALAWRRPQDADRAANEAPSRLPRAITDHSPTLAALAGVFAVLAAMFAPRESVMLAVVANAALVVPAALGIACSVRELERGTFWLSTTTLALLVLSRFLEYDTNLGVKAAAFIASGTGVILVGLRFERRLRAARNGASDAA